MDNFGFRAVKWGENPENRYNLSRVVAMVKRYRLTYWILFLGLLPFDGQAQPVGFRLGSYRIGQTTIDSLQVSDWQEEELLVKGTIALLCSHVRVLKASARCMDGLSFRNLALYFYDNKLFRISCDATPDTKDYLQQHYGLPGHQSEELLVRCATQPNKPIRLRYQTWSIKQQRACVVYSNGFNNYCQYEQGNRLHIIDQTLADLASDCNLNPANLLVEEVTQVVEKRL